MSGWRWDSQRGIGRIWRPRSHSKARKVHPVALVRIEKDTRAHHFCILMGCRSLPRRTCGPCLLLPIPTGCSLWMHPGLLSRWLTPSSTALFLHYWNVLILLHKVTVSMLDAWGDSRHPSGVGLNRAASAQHRVFLLPRITLAWSLDRWRRRWTRINNPDLLILLVGVGRVPHPYGSRSKSLQREQVHHQWVGTLWERKSPQSRKEIPRSMCVGGGGTGSGGSRVVGGGGDSTWSDLVPLCLVSLTLAPEAPQAASPGASL